MLKLYSFILQTISELQPFTRRVARADSDLGRQLRRALSSVALNVAEGSGSRGKNAQLRFHTALGSAKESFACFEVAEALGYINQLPEEHRSQLRRIIAGLTRLSQ